MHCDLKNICLNRKCNRSYERKGAWHNDAGSPFLQFFNVLNSSCLCQYINHFRMCSFYTGMYGKYVAYCMRV